jgi:pyruvate/2-oxoglutarate dehydrogenase complex dihydrolipoamide dehydrogenase (E3) component
MKVVVAGGGPAGAEAARVAALRGHEVVLLEARDALGGALNLWSQIPGRERVAATPRWYAARLEELGVDVRVSTKATREAVLAESPGVVILATGGLYSPGGQTGVRPMTLPGSEQDLVCTVEDVLLHGQRLSGRVVVLDDEGLHAASGVAEILARAGAEVELVTRRGLQAETLNTAESSFVRRRLREAGVRSSTRTTIERIGDQSVTLLDFESGETREVEVDWVVLAASRRPVDGLYRQLDGAVPYVYLVGDALAPRRLRDATYEAHRFAHVIGEPDMPSSVQSEIFREVEELKPAEFAVRTPAPVNN